METGLNTLIEKLHQNLINDINSSQLPVGIIYYVAKDVFSEIEKGYQNALSQENKKVEVVNDSEEDDGK